jgi:hypothetical protein
VTLQSHIDHLVVAAASLEEGIGWCRETFGFEPGPGGEHALMSTHNRVFRIDSAAFPRAYLEIIAVNPAAPAPGRTRWFDLDDAALRGMLSAGPRLVHFVVRTNDAAAAVEALRARNIDRGSLLAAERPTPHSVLRWKITVRSDGQRLYDGALPTLIEWGGVHPCDTLAPSGVWLASLEVSHPQAAALQAAYGAIGLGQVSVRQGPANLAATLATPHGRVRLESKGA